MDTLDQVKATLKAESKRLEQELMQVLMQVRSAIAALQGTSSNDRGMTARFSGRTISATARRRIVAAQKLRWAKWRAAQRKKAA